jgi:Na+-driven multidrug efflux pump
MSLQTDLTQGSIRRQLLRYTIPILLTSLFQSLYQVADMALVSHMVGSEGASAVSTAGQIMRTVMIVSVGFSNGGNILASQYFGGGNREQLRRTVSTLITLFLVLGATASALCFFGSGFLVDALRAPARNDTYDYLSICSVGIVFILGYNALAATLRALGNSRIPMFCILSAAALNVCLDLFFMGPLRMGTRGAALATVISQAASCAAAFWFLTRQSELFPLLPKKASH